MHPIIFALFNGLGNIYNSVKHNEYLLGIILVLVLYPIVRDFLKLGAFLHKKGWFRRSLYDKCICFDKHCVDEWNCVCVKCHSK
jgi:hypothetical protein